MRLTAASRANLAAADNATAHTTPPDNKGTAAILIAISIGDRRAFLHDGKGPAMFKDYAHASRTLKRHRPDLDLNHD